MGKYRMNSKRDVNVQGALIRKRAKRNRVKRDLPVNMSLVDGFARTMFSHSEYGDSTFVRNAETNLTLDSGKVPEDHHLCKICHGKINIVRENVICLRIPHGC
jgi:hypothetical protein